MFLHITAKQLASIILTVSMMATFLSIFFFTYGAKIERKVLATQMGYITNTLLGEFGFLIPDDIKLKIRNNLHKLKLPNLNDSDKKVTESNNKIIKNTLQLILIVLIFSFIGTFGMSYYYDFKYTDVLFISSISLIIVAITEYTFLTFFASKYLSADINFVKHKIVDIMQKNA
jgi:hypothetical protein